MAEISKTSRAARALEHVAKDAAGSVLDPSLQVTIHFHPDRPHHGAPMIAALARDGIYRSQFETGTSNGSATAFRGGSRWLWESRIFGGAYDDAPPEERPKYGALNFLRRREGASPRFGSAHLRLRTSANARATFCYPDSVFEPTNFGTAQHMSLLALIVEDRDPLDQYVEAQVHGSILLSRDVEAIVLDPCYAGTEIETVARTLSCPVEWHRGFRLNTSDLDGHYDYRGIEYVHVAKALADGRVLTAREIGTAARTNSHDEQVLKRVWHYVARFGAPT